MKSLYENSVLVSEYGNVNLKVFLGESISSISYRIVLQLLTMPRLREAAFPLVVTFVAVME